MAKRYVCEGYNKGCRLGVVHTCEQTCSDNVVSLPVYLQGLEFHATYATDTLGARRASITTKRKSKVKWRAHVSVVIVLVRVALWSSEIRTNATNDSVLHVKRTKRPGIFAICVNWWTCRPPTSVCCTYYTILRRSRIRNFLIRQTSIYEI